MTLKRLLILPLLVSLAFFAYFSKGITESFRTLTSTVTITVTMLTVLGLAVALQLIGHIIRARKTAFLFGQVKPSSTRFQFRALSVGYLFNAILPLRLGELIRARIISGGMTISFSYAFVLIIFERVIDALILGIVGLVVTLAFVSAGRDVLMTYALTLLAIGVMLLMFILSLVRQDRGLLKFWHRVTGLLNENLKTSLRFKLWSVIYGLQQTLRWPTVWRYLALTLLSWVFYCGSTLLVVQYVTGAIGAGAKSVLVVAPYYSVAVPSGPANLGVFSKVIGEFTQFLRLVHGATLNFSLMVWAVLVLPIAGIGVILLFGKTRETLWQSRPKKVSRESLEHKLYRHEDISQEMKHFLDNYFEGNSLSRIVHELELNEKFRLVKYFKGGSDAITILALQDGQEVVKKIIPLKFEDRLKAQHDWLAKWKGTPGIVNVLAEEHAGQYYAIDLEYDAENEMFYDYIHRNPIDRSKQVLEKVWEILYASIYHRQLELAYSPDKREAYIDKHILGCLDKAAAIDPQLTLASAPEKLNINGKEYDNLLQVLEKINQHPQAWRDIATLQRSDTVHGDVAVDNLLISRKAGEVLIIDPAPDGNILNGPVFDFGKNMQSLHCGYETLLRDEDPVYLVDGNRISYRDLSSEKYRALSEYVREELAPRYLTDAEQKAMLFHAGALFIRRLKHQVYFCPANVLKFYAVGVKTLNEFLAQYEQIPAKVTKIKKREKARK